MSKPSLEFKLMPAVSALRRFERLSPLNRPDKLLFPLYLFKHEPIECLVLSRCDSEQIVNDTLALNLEVSVLEWSAVHPLLEVARGLLGDTGIAREVHSHETLRAAECRAQLKDHHLV
jgi:hypothetical protein